MQNNLKAGRKPKIVIAKSEHDRLVVFATAVAAHNPDASDELLAELDRAHIVGDDKVPDSVVRMGSTVRFETDNGDVRTVTLVYPGDADISVGKVSVLTPIGTALLGLSTGQSINWTTRGGHRHQLHILDVDSEPAEQREHHGAAENAGAG